MLCEVSSVSVTRFDRCRFDNPTSYFVGAIGTPRQQWAACHLSPRCSSLSRSWRLLIQWHSLSLNSSSLPLQCSVRSRTWRLSANSFASITVLMTPYYVSRLLHLSFIELPWLSLTRSLDVGRNALRLPSSSRLTHSFSLTLILSHLPMFLHLSLYSRRRIFTRFLISTLVFFIFLVVFILELSFPYFSACMSFTDCSRIFKVMYDHG